MKNIQSRNNWLGPIFFDPNDTFSKGMLIFFHPGFDDVTDVDTDPKKEDLCPSVLHHSNSVLSKLIMDDGLEDLRRRENPEISEFTPYDSSSGTRSRIDKVCTDKKIANNTKIIHKMVSFSDHYNALFIDRFYCKTKIG